LGAASAVLCACQLVSGLDALAEKDRAQAGDEGGATPEDGTASVDTAAPDADASVDVRALSDADVPLGSYLLHVDVVDAYVSSTPPAIQCGTSGLPDGPYKLCDAVLPASTRIVLDVVGTGDFQGWGGACAAATTDQCAVVMDSDKEVSAVFTRSR
jgi:hypothetical protein